MSQDQRRPSQVFISDSHRDHAALERLQVHLKPLEREGLIERWDDTRIPSGGLWKDEIRDALASARVAVLLVSADFLASDFIAAEELPPLLEAERARGLVILPVILGPCRYTKTPSLAQFQAVNDPVRPLSKLRRPEREAIWVKLAKDIEEALGRPVTPLPGPDEGGAQQGSAEPSDCLGATGSQTNPWHPRPCGRGVKNSLPNDSRHRTPARVP